jgi:hypothetical protein
LNTLICVSKAKLRTAGGWRQCAADDDGVYVACCLLHVDMLEVPVVGGMLRLPGMCGALDI